MAKVESRYLIWLWAFLSSKAYVFPILGLCFSQSVLLFCVYCSVFALDVWIIADLLDSEVCFPLWDIGLIFQLGWLNYSLWCILCAVCCLLSSFSSDIMHYLLIYVKMWGALLKFVWNSFLPLVQRCIENYEATSKKRTIFVGGFPVLSFLHSWASCIPLNPWHIIHARELMSGSKMFAYNFLLWLMDSNQDVSLNQGCVFF